MTHTHTYFLAMQYSVDGEPQLIFTTCQIINTKNNRVSTNIMIDKVKMNSKGKNQNN